MHGSSTRSKGRPLVTIPVALAGLALALVEIAASCGEERAAEPVSASSQPAPANPAADPAPAEPRAEPSAPNADADAELRALLLRASTEPQTFDDDARILLESLAFGLFPKTEGELDGAAWQVQQTAGSPIADFHADLSRGSQQLVSIDADYHPDLDAPGLKAYGTTLVSGYPATERSRFLFVLVGHTELRMQGLADPYRSLDALHALFARFPLARIAKL